MLTSIDAAVLSLAAVRRYSILGVSHFVTISVDVRNGILFSEVDVMAMS